MHNETSLMKQLHRIEINLEGMIAITELFYLYLAYMYVKISRHIYFSVFTNSILCELKVEGSNICKTNIRRISFSSIIIINIYFRTLRFFFFKTRSNCDVLLFLWFVCLFLTFSLFHRVSVFYTFVDWLNGNCQCTSINSIVRLRYKNDITVKKTLYIASGVTYGRWLRGWSGNKKQKTM